MFRIQALKLFWRSLPRTALNPHLFSWVSAYKLMYYVESKTTLPNFTMKVPLRTIIFPPILIWGKKKVFCLIGLHTWSLEVSVENLNSEQIIWSIMCLLSLHPEEFLSHRNFGKLLHIDSDIQMFLEGKINKKKKKDKRQRRINLYKSGSYRSQGDETKPLAFRNATRERRNSGTIYKLSVSRNGGGCCTKRQ